MKIAVTKRDHFFHEWGSNPTDSTAAQLLAHKYFCSLGDKELILANLYPIFNIYSLKLQLCCLQSWITSIHF